jgi:hypothetical protein
MSTALRPKRLAGGVARNDLICAAKLDALHLDAG